MNPRSRYLRGTGLVIVIASLAACESRPTPQPDQTMATHETDPSAPSLEALQNATYEGIEEAEGVVTLTKGKWKGKPFEEGGASAPSVTFVRDFRLAGDLDGDASEEAVVLLTGSTGGTGEMAYLAVVGRREGQIRNVATAPVGDRVQVRDARIEGRRIVLDVVQAGEKDAMCCPGDLVTRSWQLQGKSLEEGAPTTTGRLSRDTLAGVEWVLRAWAWDEPVPAEPAVTLRLDEDRFVGSAGCNSYFASVTTGDMPGDLRVGAVGATRKMCPEPEMAVEHRFMRQLEGVRQLRFVAGQLALPYTIESGAFGVMLFDRRPTR